MKVVPRLQLILVASAFAGSAILGPYNFWLSNYPVDISADIAAIPPAQAGKVERATATQNPELPLEITETVKRPLFSPTRREYVPKPVTAEPVAQPAVAVVPQIPIKKPAIRFQGTSQVGGKIAALIANEDGSSADWMAVGQSVGEWRIASIELGKMTITYNNEKAVYSLYPESSDHGK